MPYRRVVGRWEVRPIKVVRSRVWPCVNFKLTATIHSFILWLQPYSLSWRNTNIQPHRTIFWWDEPQLTSVTELSEQKLPLVTPTTYWVISALSFTKTSLLGSLSCFQRFSELSLSVVGHAAQDNIMARSSSDGRPHCAGWESSHGVYKQKLLVTI